MITVIIVEDLPDHQYLFKSIVNSHSSFNCIGVFNNGNDAIEAISKCKPDVVIMDIGLPDISGVECIRRLKPSLENVNFMICTVFEEDEHIFEALKAGASGYITKGSKPYQIVDALLEVHNGHMPLSSSIATRLLKYLPVEDKDTEQKVYSKEYAITKQEATILDLLSKGYSYNKISELLLIKASTLKWHIHNIYLKMNVKNRVCAINSYRSDKHIKE